LVPPVPEFGVAAWLEVGAAGADVVVGVLTSGVVVAVGSAVVVGGGVDVVVGVDMVVGSSFFVSEVGRATFEEEGCLTVRVYECFLIGVVVGTAGAAVGVLWTKFCSAAGVSPAFT